MPRPWEYHVSIDRRGRQSRIADVVPPALGVEHRCAWLHEELATDPIGGAANVAFMSNTSGVWQIPAPDVKEIS